MLASSTATAATSARVSSFGPSRRRQARPGLSTIHQSEGAAAPVRWDHTPPDTPVAATAGRPGEEPPPGLTRASGGGIRNVCHGRQKKDSDDG